MNNFVLAKERAGKNDIFQITNEQYGRTLQEDFENVECQNESPDFNKTAKTTGTFDLIRNIERDINLSGIDKRCEVEEKICISSRSKTPKTISNYAMTNRIQKV